MHSAPGWEGFTLLCGAHAACRVLGHAGDSCVG